jgi:hypothetical protein
VDKQVFIGCTTNIRGLINKEILIGLIMIGFLTYQNWTSLNQTLFFIFVWRIFDN